MTVRVGVGAILLQEGRLVVVHKQDEYGAFYGVPGGSQELGETLVQAIQREVREETGWAIDVHELVWVREYIGRNHEYAATEGALHVVDHLFRCTLPVTAGPPQPLAPDRDQVGVEWLARADLRAYRFYPRALIPHLQALAQGLDRRTPVYLGDVN